MIKALAFLALLSLTSASYLPDKIPSIVYRGVGDLLAGMADGFSFTTGKVEDECMDQEFQLLMNDAYYYAYKAQQATTLYEPIVTKQRGLLNKFLEYSGLRGSRTEMPLILLLGEVLNDCEWDRIIVNGLSFYTSHSASNTELILSLVLRGLLLIPLVYYEWPVLVGGMITSITAVGFVMGANLRIVISI